MSDIAPDWKTLEEKTKGLGTQLITTAENSPNVPKDENFFGDILTNLGNWAAGTDEAGITPEVAAQRKADVAGLNKIVEDTGTTLGFNNAERLNALNNLTFGATGAAFKATGNKDKYEKEIAKIDPGRKLAQDVGSIFVTPGGALLKGAGYGLNLLGKGGKIAAETTNILTKGGSALTKLGQLAAGERKAGALLRGGVSALEQAIPRTLTSAYMKDDFSNAPQDIVTSGLLGAGINKGLQFLGKAIPRAARKAEDVNTEAYITGALGTSKADLNKAMNEMAAMRGIDPVNFKAAHIEELKDGLAKLGTQNNIHGQEALKEYLENTGNVWNTINNKLEKAGIKIFGEADDPLALLPQALKSNKMKDAQDLVSHVAGEGDKIVKEVAEIASKKENLFELKRYLLDEMRTGANAISNNERAKGKVAAALYDQINEVGQKIAPELGDLAKLYPFEKILKRTLAREEGPTKLSGGGSDTAMKMLLGGSVGASTNPMSITGDETTDRVLNGVLGAVAGGALNKLAPDVVNALSARLAAFNIKNPGRVNAIIDKLPTEKAEALKKILAKVPGAVSSGASTIANEIPKVVGAVTPKIMDNVKAETQAELKPGFPEDKPIEGVKEAGVKEEAKKEVKAQYMDVIENKMMNIYQQIEAKAPGAYTYEQVRDAFAQATNNFDPLKASGLIFSDPKEKKNFRDNYNKALKLKEIDLGKAVSDNPDDLIANLQDLTIGLGKDRVSKGEATKLKDVLTSVIVEEGKLPTKSQLNQVKDALSEIRNAKKEDRIQKMKDTFKQLGVDIDTYQGLGLV